LKLARVVAKALGKPDHFGEVREALVRRHVYPGREVTRPGDYGGA